MGRVGNMFPEKTESSDSVTYFIDMCNEKVDDLSVGKEKLKFHYIEDVLNGIKMENEDEKLVKQFLDNKKQ